MMFFMPSDPALEAFLPKVVQANGLDAPPPMSATARSERQNDLFADLDPVFPGGAPASRFVDFAIPPVATISADVRAITTTEMQSLAASLRNVARGSRLPLRGASATFEIDRSANLRIRTSDPSAAALAQDVWRAIRSSSSTADAATQSTPKLYGVKLRLSQLLMGAACSVLPEGAPILDVMAGTGIVTRILSDRFRVSTNDANAYAVLLARCQGARPTGDLEDLLVQVRAAAASNYEALVHLAPSSFAEEADFLHGDLDDARFEEYERFCRRPVLQACAGPPATAPYQLCISRYSNCYFGVAQCAQLDSVRAAIDVVSRQSPENRDILLAALVIAATVCSTGPHFAQPRKLTRASFRDIVERRARSVVWEFELALRRLADRPALRHPIEAWKLGDWREAIVDFARCSEGSRPAAVYFDPPYSKFQYSRYYHLLNVLLSYDYPVIEGTGRYPPMADRFSSRFEHRPRSAQSEFEEAFDLCRDLGLGVLVSYSNRGLVPVDVLTAAMCERFGEVVEFSETIRHHSQGTKLGDHAGQVTEIILAGRNN